MGHDVGESLRAERSDRIGQLSVNKGIAIVVPASKIREVIEQPIIRKSEDEKERLAREAQLPMTDGVGLDSLLTQSDRENGMKNPKHRISNTHRSRLNNSLRTF